MNLTYVDPDENGDCPNMDTLYSVFRHVATGRLYVLTDYVWICGKPDVWGAFYTASDTACSFVRPIREFFDGRFEEVSIHEERKENREHSEKSPTQDHAVGGTDVGDSSYQDSGQYANGTTEGSEVPGG